MSKSYTAIIEENVDSGELFIVIPQELIQELGWSEDDKLEWTELPNGSWTISKIE